MKTINLLSLRLLNFMKNQTTIINFSKTNIISNQPILSLMAMRYPNIKIYLLYLKILEKPLRYLGLC